MGAFCERLRAGFDTSSAREMEVCLVVGSFAVSVTFRCMGRGVSNP